MFQRALDSISLATERLLIGLGLNPNNITYDAVFDRLIELALANITLANLAALIGGIFLIATFLVRTIVPFRVLCIIASIFLLFAAAISGSVGPFLMYLLALPISIIRLFQIRSLVKTARSAAQGDLSLDWLRPYMSSRAYKKGDLLFQKGDVATEMFLTVSGKFLVMEIGIEIPPGRVMGELGFLSPKNHRTQSVECVGDGEVLTISYEKLLDVYFQKPEFGYYFLRLSSDRLMQNVARLEDVIARDKPAKAGAGGDKGAAAESPEQSERTHARRVLTVIRKMGSPRAQKRRQAAEDAAAALAAITEAARRRAKARAIVERHANFSAVGGFIPLPVLTVAAITVITVRMMKLLSQLYGAPFERKHAQTVVIGLMGGVMPAGLGTITASSIAVFVPGYNLIGLAVSSVTASVLARRIGNMLIEYFETGVALKEVQMVSTKPSRRWWSSLRTAASRS